LKSEPAFGGIVEVDFRREENSLLFPYQIALSDKILNDKLEIKYNFEPDLTDSKICLMKMGVAAFLAQSFLCKEIFIKGDIDKRLIFHFDKLLQLLYNIRNYEEGTDFSYPRWNGGYTTNSTTRCDRNFKGMTKKAINLVGGGKDSLASAILLRKNGMQIINCHIAGLNIGSSEPELNACQNLYLDLHIVYFNGLADLIMRLSSISRCLGKPPKYNYIPRGRDILTTLFALPLAQATKSTYVSLSCERDLWKNNIKGKNGIIPMHDTQSELTVTAINKIVKCVMPSVHVFSPIAGLHEIKILSWILINEPKKALHISSCFYGNWCGECSKCIRYYLIQQYTGKKTLKFRKNPSKVLRAHLKRFIENFNKPGVPYKKEISFLINNLPETTPYLSNRKICHNVSSFKKTKKLDLFNTYPARLIPRDFRRGL
jgi:7-cyano-7-deazaguanine synthase in queuosine biosynthesis